MLDDLFMLLRATPTKLKMETVPETGQTRCAYPIEMVGEAEALQLGKADSMVAELDGFFGGDAYKMLAEMHEVVDTAKALLRQHGDDEEQLVAAFNQQFGAVEQRQLMVVLAGPDAGIYEAGPPAAVPEKTDYSQFKSNNSIYLPADDAYASWPDVGIGNTLGRKLEPQEITTHVLCMLPDAVRVCAGPIAPILEQQEQLAVGAQRRLKVSYHGYLDFQQYKHVEEEDRRASYQLFPAPLAVCAPLALLGLVRDMYTMSAQLNPKGAWIQYSGGDFVAEDVQLLDPPRQVPAAPQSAAGPSSLLRPLAAIKGLGKQLPPKAPKRKPAVKGAGASSSAAHGAAGEMGAAAAAVGIAAAAAAAAGGAAADADNKRNKDNKGGSKDKKPKSSKGSRREKKLTALADKLASVRSAAAGLDLGDLFDDAVNTASVVVNEAVDHEQLKSLQLKLPKAVAADLEKEHQKLHADRDSVRRQAEDLARRQLEFEQQQREWNAMRCGLISGQSVLDAAAEAAAAAAARGAGDSDDASGLDPAAADGSSLEDDDD